MRPYLFLAVATVFNAAGQLLLKTAALRSVGASGGAIAAFLSPYFLVGVTALGSSMILWLLALRTIPMTVAHPVSGIVFAIVPIASALLWQAEKLPMGRMLGIGCIIFGIVLVARGELW